MRPARATVFARLPVSSVLLALLCGCGSNEAESLHPSPAYDAAEASTDASIDTGSEVAPAADAAAEDASHEQSPTDSPAEDGAPDDSESGEPDAEPEPLVVHAELIASSPVGQATPPTWNAHLPKLAGDGVFLYAVHTHYSQDVSGRYAAIMRRRADQPGSGWTEAARILFPHQPPGIVMDTSARLHVVFECLRPGSQDVECFPGGASTAGLTSRFYHLVFSSHDTDGSLRFDTYANHSEWTQTTNGYDGIGTTASGVTWWSLADEGWNRVVQWWASGTSFGSGPVLSKAPYYLLYPIHASSAAGDLLLYAGEFDPSGGNNASYVASVAFSGDLGGLSQLIERKPASPLPGAVNAYPSDVAYGPDGTVFLLSYLPSQGGACTELIRYEGGLAGAPVITEVGCLGTYANLQVTAAGVLYVLADGAGAAVRLGRSADKGATWTWLDVPLQGLPSNGDQAWFGMGVLKPYTSPLNYDASRMEFFFSGYDGANIARHSYWGTLQLP